MRRIPISYDEYSDEELLKMDRETATEGLTEKKQRFCECYVEGHNIRMAALKAGFKDNSNGFTAGHKCLHDDKCKRYIQWLKVRVLQKHMINAWELLDEWIRIAFSDITDFVDIHPRSITLKPADQVDGQLVKSIKSGRDGISIELYDKMKALDNIAKYCEDMPSDWKQRIEERKLQLLQEEFELKKKLSEVGNDTEEDDGFLDAIKKSTKAIWDIEEE